MGLAPGGVARIFRDGEVLVAQVAVDLEGHIVTRALPDGAYVARDEQGGEFAFLQDGLASESPIPVVSVSEGVVVRPASHAVARKTGRKSVVGKKPVAKKKAAPAKKSAKKKG